MIVLESECEWPDSEDNKRRRQFCNHIEGYGSVCNCNDPAPIIFNPEPVSFNLKIPLIIDYGKDMN